MGTDLPDGRISGVLELQADLLQLFAQIERAAVAGVLGAYIAIAVDQEHSRNSGNGELAGNRFVAVEQHAKSVLMFVNVFPAVSADSPSLIASTTRPLSANARCAS